MKWSWSNYLAKDDLYTFTRLWQKMGLLGTIVWFCFFLVGGVSWFIGIFNLDQTPAPATTALLCALLSSSAFVLAAFIYAGLAVASVAHSTQRRLNALEERLAKLEPTVIKIPSPNPMSPVVKP